MEKRIVILEGPAGAGKSTLASELVRRRLLEFPIQLAEFHKNTRAFEDPDNGVGRSLVKDILALTQALVTPSDKPLVIDRGFLSQFVYGYIRKSIEAVIHQQARISRFESVIDPLWVNELGYLIDGITSQVILRSLGDPVDRRRPSILFLVYLPPLSEIYERRANSGKEYPYEIEAEVSYYYRLVQHTEIYNPHKHYRFSLISSLGEAEAHVADWFYKDETLS